MDSNPQINISKNINKKKSSSNEDFSKHRDNPKLKLFAALNNINDEINVEIDSKDRLANNNLNLDCFLNKQSSMSSNSIKSPEVFINNKNNKKIFISLPSNKEDDLNPFAKTENSNDRRNLRKINKINSFINNNNANSNIKTDPNHLKKYINSSQNSKMSKSKNSDINNNINKNTVPNIIYINKLDNGNGIENIENGEIVDSTKKITLYNLNGEDKLLLKDMEKNNALLVTDISSLNKKNIVNYNISLSNFNIKKLLDYYLYLINENEKEQIKFNNLKHEVGELREDYLKLKKSEINNSKESNSIFDEKNLDIINIGNLSPVSRYKNDLKFFENLMIKMNNEIKNT